MVKEEITSSLKKALASQGLTLEPQIEVPSDSSKGDYSTNIAMTIFSNKELGIGNKGFKTPLDLAEKIADEFRVQSSEFRVEVAKPGFINFWVSEEYLIGELNEVIEKKEKYGSNDKLKGQKVMLEFADPNPFKEFHVGHLRNISLGESFARLLEAKNATLWRVNYQGDVGMHVAKALYGLLQISNIDKKQLQDKINEMDKKSLKEKIKLLAGAYVAGSNAYESDENAKVEIRSINIKVYQMDESIKNLWDMGKAWSLAYFEQIYNRVGTKYKHYYFESATVELAKELVAAATQTPFGKAQGKGIFEASDGAIVFRGEKQGLHTRVFLTKEGYPTYEGKDMALAVLKQKDLDYDTSIIITAHEQAVYFKVILEAMKHVLPDLAAKTVHYSFGFVSLKEGKMSSRKGNVIAGEWLLDEAKRRIQTSFKDMNAETAEQVAVGAIKYSMLKFARASDIQFSFEESISLEGNSGPYLQYTYARTQSVIKKANGVWQIANSKKPYAIRHKLYAEEEALLRSIARFAEIVKEAGEKFAPNLLCNYLFDLAQQFNLFYQKHQIIGPASPKTASRGGDIGDVRSGGARSRFAGDFRVNLTQAVGQILKNGLYLLGIEAPEKM